MPTRGQTIAIGNCNTNGVGQECPTHMGLFAAFEGGIRWAGLRIGDFAVTAAKEEQRFSVAHYHRFNFGDKDRVVARVMRLV